MAQAILFQSILTALFIIGFVVAMQDGMLLGWLPKALYYLHLPEVIKKPLYDCPTCMSSFWGVAVYYFIYGELSVYLFLIVPCTAGIITLVSNQLDISIFKLHNERLNEL